MKPVIATLAKFLVAGSAFLALMALLGCGVPDSWKSLQTLGETWRFHDMLMGKTFPEYAGVPFIPVLEEKLSAGHTRRHYVIENDADQFGPIRCSRIVYIFSRNNYLKDIRVEFDGTEQLQETREALKELFGAPQHSHRQGEEKWYYNTLLFCLRYDEQASPAGTLSITLMLPCHVS